MKTINQKTNIVSRVTYSFADYLLFVPKEWSHRRVKEIEMECSLGVQGNRAILGFGCGSGKPNEEGVKTEKLSHRNEFAFLVGKGPTNR